MLPCVDSRQALALPQRVRVQETQRLARCRRGGRQGASRTAEQAQRPAMGEPRQAWFPLAWLSQQLRPAKLAPLERTEQLHEERPERPEQPERLLAECPQVLAPLAPLPVQQQLQPSPPERSSSASSL